MNKKICNKFTYTIFIIMLNGSTYKFQARNLLSLFAFTNIPSSVKVLINNKTIMIKCK